MASERQYGSLIRRVDFKNDDVSTSEGASPSSSRLLWWSARFSRGLTRSHAVRRYHVDVQTRWDRCASRAHLRSTPPLVTLRRRPRVLLTDRELAFPSLTDCSSARARHVIREGNASSRRFISSRTFTIRPHPSVQASSIPQPLSTRASSQYALLFAGTTNNGARSASTPS